MRRVLIPVLLLWAQTVPGAEHMFKFSEMKEDQPPPGLRSVLAGSGKPGDWRIVLDETPSQMQPLTPQSSGKTQRPVLAQVSQDETDERFPMLLLEGQTFDDFTFTTRFKTVGGKVERMAGLVFRVQNETNFYVMRASSLGNTFRFYKVVNGERGNIIGPEIPIPSGVWHEMSVTCKGNEIRCSLNGVEVIPPLTDHSFLAGKIGFWTKSDSVSYFADARVLYTPQEPALQRIVREVLAKYPKLLGLKVYAPGPDAGAFRVIASGDPKDLNQPGGDTESKAMASETPYVSRDKTSASVIMPMRDRNGDVVAVVRVILSTFKGQTEKTAVVRASPIVKEMEAAIRGLANPLE